jgi:hypothetical protein
MAQHQKDDDERQDELRRAFKTAVTLVRSLLPDNAFRRYYPGTDKAPDGHWATQFNAAL